MQKFDPYINVDPGTINPIQHRKVFVTYDGCETDLDLGHYERFIDEELNFTSNITSGKIYKSVIDKERHRDYLGTTAQMVPHITNEIKNKVYEAGITSNADIVITEIGETVGDIESQSFIETLRQIQYEKGSENTFFIHCTLIPFIYGSNELKTKPTKNSVKNLRNMGIRPDALIQVMQSKINIKEMLKNSKGIIVPGGFGSRGIEGKIKAIKYARENDIPFLGICLGMQLAVIEFARNVCNIKEASSTEFDPTCKEPIIDLMVDQKSIVNMGGTLRLGNYECKIKKIH